MEKDLHATSNPTSSLQDSIPIIREEIDLYKSFYHLSHDHNWDPSLSPQEWGEKLLTKLLVYCGANKGALHLVYAQSNKQVPLLLVPLSIIGSTSQSLSHVWIAHNNNTLSQVVKQKITFYQTFDEVDTYLETSLLSLKNNAFYIAPLQKNTRVVGVIELTALVPFSKSVLQFIEMLVPFIAQQLEAIQYFLKNRLLLYEKLAIQFIQASLPFETYWNALAQIPLFSQEILHNPVPREDLLPSHTNYKVTAPFLVELDAEGKIANANEYFLYCLNLSLEEVIGMPISKFIANGSDWGPIFWENLSQGPKVENKAILLQSPKISTKKITAWFSKHPAPCGKILFLLTAFENITSLSTTNDNLQEKLAQVEIFNFWQKASSEARIGYWSYHLITHQVYWSKQMFENFDIRPPQIPTLAQMLEKIPLRDSGLFFNTLFVTGIAFAQPFEIEHRVQLSNGETKYLRTQGLPLLDENGLPYMLIGTTLDITAFKEQLQEKENLFHELQANYQTLYRSLHQFENLLKTITDSSSDFILVLDPNLHIINSNTSLQALLEKQFQLSLSTPNPPLLALLEKIASLSEPEIEIITKNIKKSLKGEPFEYALHFQQSSKRILINVFQFPIFDIQGNVEKILVIIQNNSSALVTTSQKVILSDQLGNKNMHPNLTLPIQQEKLPLLYSFYKNYLLFLQEKLKFLTQFFLQLYQELPTLFLQLSYHSRQTLIQMLEAILQIQEIAPHPQAHNPQELTQIYATALSNTRITKPLEAAKKLIQVGFCFDLSPYLELFSLQLAENVLNCIIQIGTMQRSCLLAQNLINELCEFKPPAHFPQPSFANNIDCVTFFQIVISQLTENTSRILLDASQLPTSYLLPIPSSTLFPPIYSLLSILLEKLDPTTIINLHLSPHQSQLVLCICLTPSLPPLKLDKYPTDLETTNFNWNLPIQFCLFLLQNQKITPLMPDATTPYFLRLLFPKESDV
ncbi:MAG: hypothetical protein RML72_01515 [Bacteroidia bacterium]|nr:hypothetical protein [Bacteroidia bacterium]MDW8157537.1 hypothetical protein [Bacteroidia bacterium]